MSLDKDHYVYFLGIGGTGMASVAGLAQQAGYRVQGSDANLYPPMSLMLADLKIPVKTPYDPSNFVAAENQLVVIANALSRGHPELEAVLESGVPYTSFPAFLGEHFLKSRQSIVVAGTHGKTTTSSLMAFILAELGEDPGFVIGGIPRNFPRSFAVGQGSCFVIEGDEYDTAFFDKNSKFLHYFPKHLILNNLEFDHADIFASLADIEKQFKNLIELVTSNQHIVANIDDDGVYNLLERLGRLDQVTSVAGFGKRSKQAKVYPIESGPSADPTNTAWSMTIQTRRWQSLSLECNLSGPHNVANICQVIACLENLIAAGIIREVNQEQLQAAFARFQGVTRRLDHLAHINGVDIYEDFAHHPTAVALVLEGLRQSLPDRRLIVAFEPKNATARRSIFTEQFAASLTKADQVFIGACPDDQRIPEEQRMNTNNLAARIGHKAKAYVTNEELLDELAQEAKTGDAIVFMSSGSFSGIQYQLRDRLD